MSNVKYVSALGLLVWGLALSGPVARGETYTEGVSPTSEYWLSGSTGFSFYGGDFRDRYDGGSLGYSFGAGVMQRLGGSPLFGGMDFALIFWSYPNDTTAGGTIPIDVSRQSIGIQLLPTLVYRFETFLDSRVSPYFGFSLGPNLFIHRRKIPIAGSADTNSDTQAFLYFQLLARPGLEIHLTDSIGLALEPKFGLLNWDLIFMPQVSLNLSI